MECDVANFAVKGLFFRSKEDQEAACTLQVGDPLHMEHEPDNQKDPNAMKVTILCPYISIIRAITGSEGPASSNARKVCFMTLDTPIGAYFV